MTNRTEGGRFTRPPFCMWRASSPLAIAAFLLVLAADLSLAGSFPAASTGDIWFQVDQAGFMGENGDVIEEYYFRVAHDQLQFEAAVDSAGAPFYEGQVYIELTFLDDSGDELGKASGTFTFSVADEEAAHSADRVQLFLMREPLHPRTAEVRFVMEDMNARKRGLIYLITKKRRNGTARASLTPPPFPGHDLGVSDIQFAWIVEPAGRAARFFKNGFNVVPNPGRNYGLYQDSLQVYYEVYDSKPPAGGLYTIRREIKNDQGKVLAAALDSVAVPAGRWVHTPGFNVKNFPAGTFDFAVTVTDLAGNRMATSSRTFNIVLTENSWGRTEQDVLNEARVLLPEDEYDRFKEMQAGDRETHLAGFWTAHDPSNNTARNELRELFLKRVEYANRNFSTSFEKGLISDRGRIYIRYGQPDEVTREVMPQIGSTLSDVLDGMDEGRPELSRLKSGSSNVDTRPYEIWTYTRQGEPLFPERETFTSTSGLTFIFVDDQGFGNYTLKYSSSYKRY